MVEVFKTNITDTELSKRLIRKLLVHFPDSMINFDLEDCDRILRVEAVSIDSEKIIKILNVNGYSCEVLV
jgi:hypothetical protein